MNDAREQFEGQQWQELEAMKEQVDRIEVPAAIDEAIRSGMRLGRARRRRRTISRLASYTAMLMLLAMVASIRFSPVVAAYVGDIPGLRAFVELINHDKGLELALENDYMQRVGLSDEHDGIKLTVDGIIADETRVIVFYTLENMDGKKRVVNLQRVQLGNSTTASSSYGTSAFEEDWESKQGTIDFYFDGEADIPDMLDLEVMLGKDHEAAAADGILWKVRIPVDKTKFVGLKETYAVNKTVTVEGQRITFGTMTVYPTRIGLEVEYDRANTKKLFYFDDIRIEDEKGETFGSILNGMSASVINENKLVLYFQSNYFRKPKQLYLRANSIRALDKSKLEVQIDLERKKLLSRPDDRITLTDVGTNAEDGQGVLDFHLKNDDPLDEGRSYSLFDSSYKDASGQTFDSNMTGSSQEEYQYYIRKEKYQSPLTLTIADYPTRIRGDIDVRIK
ncbi:DUF4179 domain-containing protein [Paenibacillus silvisoli]|uniref:DUF4179 domain-containing protein n=1 Tax=Paenibacillus silvisoli TaxID=3110539 RepID=UPI002803D4A0|nr:DUF4179 domain-containing protein [Paenibacillus silvisoli]